MEPLRQTLQLRPDQSSKNSRDRLALDAPSLAEDYADLFNHPAFQHFWGMLEDANLRLTNRLIEMDWESAGDTSVRDARIALNTIKQVMAIPGIVESTASMQRASGSITDGFNW